MKPFEFFRGETHFQEWVVDNITSYSGHVQPLAGDDRYPGIPDLSIGLYKQEVWAEVKCWRGEHDVYCVVGDAMKKERALTAQQRQWLKDRSKRWGSLCGVLIAWRNKHGANYVSFIPIDRWDEVLGWNFATLALSRYTETLNRLVSDRNTIPGLLREITAALRESATEVHRLA